MESNSHNTYSNVLEYKYKIDVSNSKTHSDILDLEDNIYHFLINNLQIQNPSKTTVLVQNRDCSLRISHSSIFILIINHITNKIINKDIFLIYIHLSNK
jgi:hypothetical protein